MEKGRGFLIHMAEVYPIVVPYLKGTYITLESWQPIMDHDSLDKAPKNVQAAPQLYNNLQALNALSEATVPPPCILQGTA
eukprot:3765277-Ditylum_brightwellii.AAC.1